MEARFLARSRAESLINPWWGEAPEQPKIVLRSRPLVPRIDFLGQTAAEPPSFGLTIKNVPAANLNRPRPRLRAASIAPEVFEFTVAG